MAQDYTLLKTQKNEVFMILRERGFEPANFSWVADYLQVSDTLVSRLNYLDGKYYFQFEAYGETGRCVFSPGQEMAVQGGPAPFWMGQKNSVKFWSDYLKREIDAPDLWAEMEKYKTSVSIALPKQLLNEPIPANEAENISEKLSSLADKIEKQFELTNEQNQFVRNKLNYLADAAKRQRSIDWVHTSIGVYVTIAMGLALAPEQAKELWKLIKSIVGGFIHLISS